MEVATQEETSNSDPTSLLRALKLTTKSLFESNNNPIFQARAKAESAVLEKYKKFIVIDLETTTQVALKRIASPFLSTNYVVLPGYFDYTGKLWMPPSKLTARNDFQLPCLDGYDVIVGHNIKFDLLYMWQDHEVKKFFARGGRVWDTLYAEYLLTGQNSRMGRGINLSDVAIRYGGTSKLDVIKEMWSKGICTKDIDYGLLAAYLEGDLRNTELVFRKQLSKAVEQHQAQIIDLRMDIVPCTTEMEFNGLYIDVEEGTLQYKELRESIVRGNEILGSNLPPEVPVEMHQQINWNASSILKALCFGGNVKISSEASESCANITCPMELALFAKVEWTTKFKRSYAAPYMRQQGLSTNRAKEWMEDWIIKNRTFDFCLVLCVPKLEDGLFLEIENDDETEKVQHFSFFNPLTKKHLDTETINENGFTSFENALGLVHDRVVILTPRWCRRKILQSLANCNIQMSEGKYSYARADGLATANNFNSTIEFDSQVKTCEDFWNMLGKMCGSGSSDESQANAVMLATAHTLATPHDCYVSPTAAVNRITFPGLVNKFFSNEAEQKTFLEKHLTEKGKQQVTAGVMLAFAQRGCEVSNALLKLRSLSKLMGTYLEMYGKGMMSLVNSSDSCIHHQLTLSRTITSRLASANPNCQNIPKHDRLRKVFMSRFPHGVCIEIDYSQLEVIVLAVLSQDEQMLLDLKNGVDFHCKRVTLMKPELSYDDVFRLAKKEKNPEFVQLRQKAKVFSFQRQYGAGSHTIAENTGLSLAEVEKLSRAEDALYPRVKAFNDFVRKEVLHVKPPDFGIPRTNINEQGLFKIVTGTRFVFDQISLEKQKLWGNKKPQPRVFLSTQLKNYPVQGFAGEIVQVMLGRLWRQFLHTNNYGGRALLTNTVHDSVWIDCRREVAKEVVDDAVRILSSVKEVFGSVFPELKMSADFPVEAMCGNSMATLEPSQNLPQEGSSTLF